MDSVAVRQGLPIGKVAAPGPRLVMAIFATVLAIGLLFGIGAFWAVRAAMRGAEELTSSHTARAVLVERLSTLSERLGRTSRSYVITGDPKFREELDESRERFERTVSLLRPQLQNPELRALLEEVARQEERHGEVSDRALVQVSPETTAEKRAELVAGEMQESRAALDRALSRLNERERTGFEAAQARMREKTTYLLGVVGGAGALALGTVLLLGAALSTVLRRMARHRLELERANRDLDAFAGRVSHDLRNLFTPVLLSVRRLRQDAGDPEVARAAADRIGRVTERAERLVEALLGFARAGRPSDDKQSAAARTVLDQTLEDLEALRERTGASVEVASQDDTLRVACAPGLLHVVLFNLIGNALKFLDGRERRTVRVRIAREGRSVLLVVEDSGPGMTSEVRANVFRPFYRAPGVTAPGFGIGLATVHRIVESHRGAVAIDSTPGEGTKVTVRFPAADAERR